MIMCMELGGFNVDQGREKVIRDMGVMNESFRHKASSCLCPQNWAGHV